MYVLVCVCDWSILFFSHSLALSVCMYVCMYVCMQVYEGQDAMEWIHVIAFSPDGKLLAVAAQVSPHIHTYLHTYLPTYIHTYPHTYPPTYIPTHLPTYPPTYLPTYLPTGQQDLHLQLPQGGQQQQ